MGILQDYIRPGVDPKQLELERKAQLRRIGALRGRAVIAYAGRLTPVPGAALPVEVNYSDLLPFHDLLGDLEGDAVDVILETPGGDGVVARDMVEMLHERFAHVAFIIPGWAKSAGTIMAMGAHEILMGPTSALGPIDAQLQFEGKRFSADALLEGMRQIQQDVQTNGLSPALIPMLQRISPGDLQNAKNAMDFARVTVTEWLARHKFSTWTHHRTHNPGAVVTDTEKELRASEIANELSMHSKWKTHGRSLRLNDLVAMRLEIEDYTAKPDLCDAIRRYYMLQRLFLDNGNVFKIIETPASEAVRRFAQAAAPSNGQAPPATGMTLMGSVLADVRCRTCGNTWKVQANFAQGQPLAAGAIAYPDDDRLTCQCGTVVDLKALRDKVEKSVGRPVLTGQP